MKYLMLVLTATLALGCGKPPAAPSQTASAPEPPGKSSGVIAFHSNRMGNYQIYAVNADGTDLHPLTSEIGSNMFPKWSAAGDRLAYTVDHDGIRISHIDFFNPNTPMLLVPFAFKDTAFSWSPDGHAIAYHGAIGTSPSIGIHIQDEEKVGLTPINDHPGRDEFPAWSPGVSQIAFQTDRDGNWEIYLMNADGTGPVNLSRNAADDRLPSWSPDGRSIAFTSNRDGNDEIYAINTDGMGLRRLTNNPAQDSYPSWSPDGREIAFQSDRTGNPDVFVMNADGSNVRNLTNNPAADGAPSWARDGRIYKRKLEELVRLAKAGDMNSLLKLLAEPFDVNARDGMLLNEAVLSDQIKIVEMLLQKGADPNLPHGQPLLDSIINRHRDIAFLLLRSGADPNRGFMTLYDAAAQGDVEMMRTLLEKKADVNENASVGAGTALIGAIENDQAGAVDLLLQHGADPSIGAKFHGYPFEIARERKNQQILDLLRKYRDNCKDSPEVCN